MTSEIQDLSILIFDTLLLFTEWIKSHLDLFFHRITEWVGLEETPGTIEQRKVKMKK